MSPQDKDPARGLNAAVAAVLRGEMSSANMTFDALADISGISKRTLLRKMGKTIDRHLGIDDLATLAPIFKLTPTEVVELAEQRMAREGRRNPLADRIRAHLDAPVQQFEETSPEPVTEGKEMG